MGLGVLESRSMDHVPGTTRYFDDPERPQYSQDGTHGLKCDTSGSVPIILVPQPSDDPNDPLNWPLWKRDLITFILSLTAIFATALGPILAANTVTLVLAYERDFTAIALLTGYFLLGCGFAGAFWVPTSRLWGKRHAFIFGTLVVIISSAWAGASNKKDLYTSMLWSRIFQGIGTAPFEALVNAAVGDLYFVHQRGKRMAFTNLAVFGGAFFTPIIVGKITHTIMWWWTFHLVAIFTACCLPALIFFCPETAYRRDSSLNVDMIASDNTGVHTKVPANGNHEMSGTTVQHELPTPANTAELDAEKATEQPNGQAPVTTHHQAPGADAPPATLRQRIALFNGRKTDENFFKLFLRPFPLFFHPAFLWASLIQGTMIGWTVFIGVLLAQFFFGPPLWWDEVTTGYAYTGAFVGAILGFIIAGGLADWSAKWMTRRNGGVYEPEFRLVLIIPQLVFGCAGLYGFGAAADQVMQGRLHWSVPLVFFGLEVCGMVIGAVASSLYILDAYRDLAIEGFTCMIIFKNFFSFALTFRAYDWILENKTKGTPVFNALGTVQLVVCLLTIPMYVYGKRTRAFFFKNDIMKICGLR